MLWSKGYIISETGQTCSVRSRQPLLYHVIAGLFWLATWLFLPQHLLVILILAILTEFLLVTIHWEIKADKVLDQIEKNYCFLNLPIINVYRIANYSGYTCQINGMVAMGVEGASTYEIILENEESEYLIITVSNAQSANEIQVSLFDNLKVENLANQESQLDTDKIPEYLLSELVDVYGEEGAKKAVEREGYNYRWLWLMVLDGKLRKRFGISLILIVILLLAILLLGVFI